MTNPDMQAHEFSTTDVFKERQTVSRRTVIAALASIGAASTSLAAGLATAAAAFDQPVLARFIAASERLTGRKDLNPDFARRLLEALTANPANATPLKALLEAPSQKGAEDGAGGATRVSQLEGDIRAAWRAGSYASTDGKSVYMYEGALCWSAAPYLKPPGVCGGDFGFWANPPAS
jgi:hypothetical protein